MSEIPASSYQRPEVGEPKQHVPAAQEPRARPVPGNKNSGHLKRTSFSLSNRENAPAY